jgi:hypothetical protein
MMDSRKLGHHGAHGTYALAAVVSVVWGVSACDESVDIGDRFCPQAPPWANDAGATPDPDASVPLPWSTGFEYGFCDYERPFGFCYGSGPASSYTLVTSPVHSGRYAAAFTVNSAIDGGTQLRCVQQGIFPRAAYYGAWYYIPTAAQNTGDWNLLHFASGTPGALNGLWDVSLSNLSDGGLHMTFLDPSAGGFIDTSALPLTPIGRWFHIEVYFKRASDGSGASSPGS